MWRNPEPNEVEAGDKTQGLPRRVDRKTGAQIITYRHFPVSPRTLERWPLKWRNLNGRAVVETTELLTEAQRRVDEAPEVRGGYGPVT